MITEQQVRAKLEEVLDPELMMDVVNIGLIYGIEVSEDGRKVAVLMTLTTMGCPAFDGMRQEIVERVKELGVEEVEVQLTFDPPWSKERMSEEAQTIFRYLF